MIAGKILWAIDICFQIYFWMICVRCLLTWLPNLDWNNNPLLNGLKSAVDLYLNLFRKIIPPVGPFDFSPIAAMIILMIIRWGILFVAAYIFSMLGLLG
ncbi:YggT family protein [bacterium]|nr:YggT family protein [bacterium]MBP3847471.1 YggT family protein [bacterium]